MPDESEAIDIQTDGLKWLNCPQCAAKIVVAIYPPFSSIECPNCHERITVPAKLGQYLLLRMLGRGNMGAVYEAQDETLGRKVAIKVMRRSLGDDEGFVQQFLREARALAALNHPNVVQIYTCGKEKGQPYIVMEFVSGSRFDQYVGSGNKQEEAMVLQTGIDIAQGLEAASNIGLTHGDVKPENILFDTKMTAKIADFGLARFSGEDLSQGHTWGTPLYISPEAAHGNPPDQRSDIYSLGATLFHAFAGEPPFSGTTVQETVLARFKEPARPLQALRPDIHPETAAIIARMLEKDPFLRYPNYNSLLADMRQTRGLLDREKAPAHKPKKKSSAVPFIVSIVFLVLAVIAAALLWQAAERKEQARRKRHSTEPRRMMMVDGKLVPIPDTGSGGPGKEDAGSEEEVPAGDVKDSGTPVVAQSAVGRVRVSVTTAGGIGADAYVQGPEEGQYGQSTGFGQDDVIWVKAGRDAGIHLARKAYLKFDLSKVTGNQVTEAELVLMAAPSGKNSSKGLYKLQLWGVEVQEEDAWSDGSRLGGAKLIGWPTAPGNDTSSLSDMGKGAELLAVIDVPANPAIGQKISFSNEHSIKSNGFANFLAARLGRSVTLAITGDDASVQRAGWKFASKEHSFLVAPTLIMKGPVPAE